MDAASATSAFEKSIQLETESKAHWISLCPFLPVKTQISHVRSSFYTDSSALSPASSLPLQECIDGGERGSETAEL